MDQREFNKQMGSYLKDRKGSSSRSSSGKGFFSSLKSSFSVEVVDDDKPVQQPDSVSVEDVQAVMRGEHLHASEDDFDEEAFVEEYKPKGFWASLKESLFGSFSEQELLHEEPVAVIERKRSSAVDEDVKEMLRTCVSWVNLLPSEEISRIKRSPEYEEFKRLLEKYELIKK
ncbi:MAG: hypothetical protein ACMXYD_03805 [Candidatus Woesearchaeota archaeon]